MSGSVWKSKCTFKFCIFEIWIRAILMFVYVSFTERLWLYILLTKKKTTIKGCVENIMEKVYESELRWIWKNWYLHEWMWIQYVISVIRKSFKIMIKKQSALSVDGSCQCSFSFECTNTTMPLRRRKNGEWAARKIRIVTFSIKREILYCAQRTIRRHYLQK